MLADAYLQKRADFGGFSVTNFLTTAATTADLPLPAIKTGKRLFIQRVRILVQVGSAGKTLQLASSGGAQATILTGLVALDTAGTTFTGDYGPEGIPMTAGELVKATISAAGAAVAVHFEGYEK